MMPLRLPRIAPTHARHRLRMPASQGAQDVAPSLTRALWRRLRHAGMRTRTRRQLAAVAAIRAQMAAQQRRPAGDVTTLRQLLKHNHADHTNRHRSLAAAALAAEASLGLRAHDTQLAAAHALLSGCFVEMATGEGKTLVVALAATAGALSGLPVHVITANDYLVERDAAEMAPLFAHLGLRVATVCASDAPAQRHTAYGADITYLTARELVFDALRDAVLAPTERDTLLNQTRHFTDPTRAAQRLQRGQHMAIIDEADSVLIDEARIPLILSRPQTTALDTAALKAALACATGLHATQHFQLDTESRRVTLTDAGRLAAESLGGHRRARDARLCQALAALHLYRRDRDYVVKDDRVQIIDTQTGRIADGRAWSQELHRFIELKEGCPLGQETTTAAQMTYQRFFPRYRHLAGISGTLAEAAAELATVYDRPIIRLPTHKPLARRIAPPRVFATQHAMWQAAAERAAALAEQGRAVLIGTDSVRDSRQLAATLTAAGIEHTVLDALQDADEAAIVAQAGQPGRITVATRMAGRGTDIRLADAVRAAGGLHVICCQHNPNRRIDRQLIGRSARQGDPGSAEHFRALDADAPDTGVSPAVRRALTRFLPYLPERAIAALFRLGQDRTAARERQVRAALLRDDHARQQRHAYRGTGL